MVKKSILFATSLLVILALVLSACSNTGSTTTGTTVVGSTTPGTTTTATTTTATTVTTASPVKTPGEPVYGGTLGFVVTSWSTLDPYRFHDQSYWTLSLVFEKLSMGNWAQDRAAFDFPYARGPVPVELMIGQLAESWEMPDPLTINFKIKQGIKWQNKAPTFGRDLTVDDILYSFKMWMQSPFIDQQFSSTCESVNKIAQWTVQVKIKPPAKVNVLAGFVDGESLWIVPKEDRDPVIGEITDWHNVTGTGPFILTDFVPDSMLTYTRNPNYWGYDEKYPKNKLPYADGVKYYIIPDMSTRLAAFRTGKIAILMNVSAINRNSLLQSNPGLQTKSVPSDAPPALRMRWDLPPFTDVRVRMAVSMAIDRQGIIKSIYQGEASNYNGLLSPFHVGLYTPFDKFPDDIKAIMTYNPEKAKQLLKEAGYPNGFTCDINCLNDTTVVSNVQIIQQNLKAVGITVNIIANDKPTFDAIRYGKQHKALIMHWNSFNVNPLELFAWFADPAHKFGLSCVNDPVYTAMYNKAIQTFDDAARNDLTRKMDEYSLRQVFYAALPFPQYTNMWQPYIGGYQGEANLGNYQMGVLAARIWIKK